MHIQGLLWPAMIHGPDELDLHVPGWSWPIPVLREVPNARAVAAPVPPDTQFLSGEVGQALPLPTLIPRDPPLVMCLGHHSGKRKSYRSCIQA